MPELERVGTLEVHQDLDFQRREWRIQKLGWALMFLFLVAAVLGIFGTGPVSNATVGERDSAAWADYQRFGRRGAPLTLRVHVRPAATQFRVVLDRAYVETVRVQAVTPQPQSTQAAADHLIYIFEAAEPGQATAVTFDLQADQIGLTSGRVQAEGRELGFVQFIYP